MLNFLDTQRTHSVFASDWFRECGEKVRSQQHSRISQISRHVSQRGGFLFYKVTPTAAFKIASVFMRLDHVASLIVNPNHSIM